MAVLLQGGSSALLQDDSVLLLQADTGEEEPTTDPVTASGDLRGKYYQLSQAQLRTQIDDDDEQLLTLVTAALETMQ